MHVYSGGGGGGAYIGEVWLKSDSDGRAFESSARTLVSDRLCGFEAEVKVWPASAWKSSTTIKRDRSRPMGGGGRRVTCRVVECMACERNGASHATWTLNVRRRHVTRLNITNEAHNYIVWLQQRLKVLFLFESGFWNDLDKRNHDRPAPHCSGVFPVTKQCFFNCGVRTTCDPHAWTVWPEVAFCLTSVTSTMFI